PLGGATRCRAPSRAVKVPHLAVIADDPYIAGAATPDAAIKLGRWEVRAAPARAIPVIEVGRGLQRPDVVGRCAPHGKRSTWQGADEADIPARPVATQELVSITAGPQIKGSPTID